MVMEGIYHISALRYTEPIFFIKSKVDKKKKQ